MTELFAPYRYATPFEIAILLFPLGLVLGSFSSVLWYRIPRRMPWGNERSQCPHCGHTLGPLDLFPVLSFLWQRGKCRYCHTPISWRYPMLELACGLTGSLGGWLAGWSVGFGALGAWLVVVFAGSFMRRAKFDRQQGSSLVEVIIAVALLVAVAIPMLDFVATVRGGVAFQRQMAATIAASVLESVENDSYRTAYWPISRVDPPRTDWVGAFQFDSIWTVESYSPAPNDVPAELNKLRQVNISVSCVNCSRPMPPVKVVAIIGTTNTK